MSRNSSGAGTADGGIAPRLGRGSNQVGVRLYNERLVLSLIRRHGSLPKAGIARLTGLSAQTISVIVGQLAKDGLVTAEQPTRGRVGQPSVPFSLNPQGALAFGLKIGRRSAEMVLVDFLGAVLADRRTTYPYPVPDALLHFAHQSLGELTGPLSLGARARIAGLGVAMPFEIWSWREEMGAPEHVLEAWQAIDVPAELAARCDWPVQLCNDGTAACGAELILGRGGRFQSFVYLFVGSFVGGGIVQEGSLVLGRTGNAGAVGSILVSGPTGARQLIRGASLYVLERRLRAHGQDPLRLWQSPDDWDEPGDLVTAWLAEAALNMAEAIVSTSAVFDFEAAVIDGALPPALRRQLVDRIRGAVDRLDRQGLSPIEVVEGTIGSRARAIGAACMPLLAAFAQDRDVLFKNTTAGTGDSTPAPRTRHGGPDRQFAQP